MTLVSIVTPTRPDREALLTGRCIPSVQALDWPDVEHVIVSDPNPGLGQRLAAIGRRDGYAIRLAEINDTWRDGVQDLSTGAVPWRIGSLMALGEHVGFLGDDDELLPDHVSRHAAALADHDFSISPILFRVGGQDRQVIGDAFDVGHLDSDGIMCRRSALRVATWDPYGDDCSDYRMVAAWLAKGLRGVLLGGEPTGIHHDGWMARRG